MGGLNNDPIMTTTEIVDRAHRTLPPPLWDYVVGGAETEATLVRNRESIAAWAFCPRVLRDVTTVDISQRLLGGSIDVPFLFAPIGSLQTLTPDGGAAIVAAAADTGAIAVISSVTEPELEVSAAAGNGRRWFQLYFRGDDAWTSAMIGRVEAADYSALMLTVDVAHYGHRERQLGHNWVAPSRVSTAGENFQAALTWRTVERVKAQLSIPLGIKGIQTAADARLAIECGADVIWVSNHGGRQLDHARGSLDMLPEIVEAVAGRAPVIVDGGFFRGPDIVKALCLGATAVALGKLTGLAVAAGGAPALVRLAELLAFEITNAMAMLGVTAVSQLDQSYVQRIPTAVSTRAFPLAGDGWTL